jgi:hypothetical protein
MPISEQKKFVDAKLKNSTKVNMLSLLYSLTCLITHNIFTVSRKTVSSFKSYVELICIRWD